MRKKRVLTLAGAMLGVQLVCVAAFAIMIPQTVEQLTVSSTDIVRATVRAKESRWNEAHSMIFTYITLSVLEPYKGALAVDSTVTVRIWGGVVGDTAINVEHAPCFVVGEEVVTFLRKKDSVFGVSAWEQGKFTLINGQVKEKGLPLGDFVESVRKALEK